MCTDPLNTRMYQVYLHFKSDTLIQIMETIHFCKHLFVDIDYCEPDQCQNGGICTDLVDGYTCSCATGYTGNNCENGNCLHISNIRVTYCSMHWVMINILCAAYLYTVQLHKCVTNNVKLNISIIQKTHRLPQIQVHIHIYSCMLQHVKHILCRITLICHGIIII